MKGISFVCASLSKQKKWTKRKNKKLYTQRRLSCYRTAHQSQSLSRRVKAFIWLSKWKEALCHWRFIHRKLSLYYYIKQYRRAR